MSLYPTKTRLALLQAVADGDVARHANGADTWMAARVTARVTELEKAGWVGLGGTEHEWPRVWEITRAGQAILDGYGRLAAVTA